jgi:hypothetical protein
MVEIFFFFFKLINLGFSSEISFFDVDGPFFLQNSPQKNVALFHFFLVFLSFSLFIYLFVSMFMF